MTHNDQRAAQQALADAITKLPPPLCEVFVLRCVQQLTGATVAQRLGLTEGEVRTQLVAALRLLRDAQPI